MEKSDVKKPRAKKAGGKKSTNKQLEMSPADILTAYKETYDLFHGFDAEQIKNAKKFTLDGTVTRCFCTKVYDGDTVHLSVVIHNDVYKVSCRMYGYNSAEMRPKHADPEKNKAEKEKAIAARDYLSELICGKYVIAQFMPEEKYGRALANIYLVDAEGKSVKCVNKMMIESGHGAEYYGMGEKNY